MRSQRLKAIACTISRGGFSDERVFKIALTDGTYVGIASRRHMWKADGSVVEPGEPPLGDELEGSVAVRILELTPDGKTATVSVPDGNVIELPVSMLVDRPEKADAYVSV